MFFFTDGVGEVVRDETSHETTTIDLSRRLAKNAELPLLEQMQATLADAPSDLLDDLLLAGCEVTAG